MIKSTELRIGNWIKQAFGYCQVRGTAKNAIWLNDEGGPVLIDSFMLIEPIPLTEETLLKCGFVKTENDIFVLNDFWFINGNLSMNRPDIKRTKRLGRPLKYFIHAFIKSDINSLHQLQNLIFALTGEELIFNK